MGAVEEKHSGGHLVRWFEQRSRLRHGTSGAVEVLTAIECEDFGTVVCQDFSPDTASACVEGLFGGHGPKDQRLSGEKESWPSQPHGKSFFKAQRKRLSPVLEEAALPTQMAGLRARGADRASHSSRALWRRAAARGKSACALFVDVVAAFHGLPRKLACGFAGSAESLAECPVKSRVPAAWTHPLPGAVSALISKHWCERRTEMHG